LIKNQLDQGVHGFVVNGTTAESPTLTKQEVKDIFALVKSEVGGQVPLILGVGSNSTAATVEFTREGSQWKPDGVLVVVPYYNKPPQRGLVQHFKAVASATELPVILYNVPGRTITSMDPETVGELTKTKNIVAIKEATGNIELLNKIKAVVPKDFTLLSGDDGTVVDFRYVGAHEARERRR
jgi:4-hydroxy-tetrahydrodipicolinate synthase